MRLIKNLFRGDINVTIFDFGLKYVVKFEYSRMEQTFKLDKFEIGDADKLEESLNDELIRSVKDRFDEMSKEFNKFYKL